MIKTCNAFSFPIQVGHLNLNTDSMIEYCLSLEKQNIGVQKSNIGGWQSHNLSGEIAELNDLFKEIMTFADKFRDIVGYKDNLEPEILNLWVNINYTHCYNTVHTHPGSIFSGVYYLQANEDSGNIVFINPYDFADNPDFVKEYKEFNSPKYYQTPEPQKIIMFPSYLRHYVDANSSLEKRISISFNIGLKFIS